jgi:ribosome-associated protein
MEEDDEALITLAHTTLLQTRSNEGLGLRPLVPEATLGGTPATDWFCWNFVLGRGACNCNGTKAHLFEKACGGAINAAMGGLHICRRTPEECLHAHPDPKEVTAALGAWWSARNGGCPPVWSVAAPLVSKENHALHGGERAVATASGMEEGHGGKPVTVPLALQLERLGESLIKLKPGMLVRVPLPDDLRAAVVEAQRILAKKAFGGYRRQVQLVGKIMRTVDAEPIAEALEVLRVEGTLASAAFQRAERWRERLLDRNEGGDDAIAALCAEAPGVDRTALRQLVRAAEKERLAQATNAQKPSTAQKKLFRLLRETFEPGIASEGNADGAPADADADAG